MLQYLPQVSQTINGLGVITSTQRPFVRFLVKNWPLALFAGYAIFARGRERYKKQELNAYNMMADIGLVLSPLVGLALLNQLAEQDHDRQTAIANGTAPAPIPQPSITDAISAMLPQAPPEAAAPAAPAAAPDPGVQGFDGYSSHLGPPGPQNPFA